MCGAHNQFIAKSLWTYSLFKIIVFHCQLLNLLSKVGDFIFQSFNICCFRGTSMEMILHEASTSLRSKIISSKILRPTYPHREKDHGAICWLLVVPARENFFAMGKMTISGLCHTLKLWTKNENSLWLVLNPTKIIN